VIYLASPYSHPDPLIMRTRFLIAEQFVVHILKKDNLIIFSPIVYCHKLAVDNALPTDANFYMVFNMNMLRRSEAMFRLELKGWEESKGVEVESNIAKMLSIPIVRFDADFVNLTEQSIQ
jgi:hypothetical protein